jgi:hypothetical protein
VTDAAQTTQGDSDKTSWGRRTIIIAAVVMILLAVYALSIGPVFVLLFRSDLTPFSWVEDVIQVVYWPLTQVVQGNEQIEEWYQDYVTWWLRITDTDVPFGPP